MPVSQDYRYIIGIDLGTTNCAVSYADMTEVFEKPKSSSASAIRNFKIQQLTGPGEVTRRPMLPSFLYLTGNYEISKESVALPWPTSNDYVSGIFAREHGAKVPARLVSSAKSWLCYGGVDRGAKILPWGADEAVGKVSPIQASAAYLNHIRQAWNHSRGWDPEHAIENQMVIITVPASFDEVARDLTIEAARQAGLLRVTLIEEPLAAFYSWLIKNESQWQSHVTPGELILVCDVGGGTTDFTLITLRETDGSPRFERLAVGDHLILGGDNMDIALAGELAGELKKRNIKLTGDRYKMLVHQCRQAKEAILNGEKETGTITLMGEGSRLIAGTVRADLPKALVEKTVLEDFFPILSDADGQNTLPATAPGELGLPLEGDSAITRHLGRFLQRHQADVKRFSGKETPFPDLILFNGGALKSGLVQERIREAIRHWFDIPETSKPRVLFNPDHDTAVSLGAAYYGLVKSGIGVRVGSGSPRAYYLGISRSGDADNTGKEAVCLVERGLDEGSNIELPDTQVKVVANQPVQFDIYSSSYRSGDRCGDVILLDDSFTRMPPVKTIIEFGKKEQRLQLPVHVEGEYTEMGTLSLWCRSEATPHRWQLQFQLRDSAMPLEVSDLTVLEDSVIDTARTQLKNAFSNGSDRQAMASLVKTISSGVGLKKERWPLAFIRRLADDLIELSGDVKKNAEREIRWMNLLGYCMRPGRGDGFDSHRIKKLWKFYKPGPNSPNNPQVRSEWWVLWRRLAAGMSPGHQRQISQDLAGIMGTGKVKGRRLFEQERIELWMLIANLEQLMAKDKKRWGRLLVQEITGPACKHQLLWALSRLGARELLYGPADRVVPPGEAFVWCRQIMSVTWKNASQALSAVGRMARKTGDRVRDFDSQQRDEIINWMSLLKNSDDSIEMVREVVPMAVEEEGSVFGESLPAGLILHE
jgi:molecular chaperone DnaK (HSP70)